MKTFFKCMFFYVATLVGFSLSNFAFSASDGTCELPQMYLRSTVNYWGISNPMDCIEGSWVASLESEQEIEYKFGIDSWVINFGDDDLDGIGEQDGRNILLPPGSYIISLNEETLAYSAELQPDCVHGKLYASGDFNNWNLSAPMDCENNVWTVKINAETEGVIVITTIDWDVMYGDSNADSIAELSGAAFAYPAGESILTFNEEDLSFSFRDAASCIQNQIFVRASDTQWDDSLPMTCNGGIWTLTQTFTEIGLFHFSDEFWYVVWGDDNEDGIAEKDGTIMYYLPGTLTFTFNESTLEYSIEGQQKGSCLGSLYVTGSFNNGQLDTPMTCDSGVWTATFDAESSGHLRIANESFALYYGDDNGDNIAENYAKEIPYSAGTITITFDESTRRYSMQNRIADECQGMFYARGEFNGWSLDAPMSCTGGIWTIHFDTLNGGEFKLATADWSEYYGDSNKDGIAEQEGNYIQFPSGPVTIVFNETTLGYTVRSGFNDICGETIYVRGSFDNWGITTPMSCLNGIWTATLDLEEDGELKFADSSWVIIDYGDNDNDGIGDWRGANIPYTAGNLLITFDEIGLTYSIENIDTE